MTSKASISSSIVDPIPFDSHPGYTVDVTVSDGIGSTLYFICHTENLLALRDGVEDLLHNIDSAISASFYAKDGPSDDEAAF